MPAQAAARNIPANPAITTRLYLGRLERKGVTDVSMLSDSEWETINRLEAVSAKVDAENLANGRDILSFLARSRRQR